MLINRRKVLKSTAALAMLPAAQAIATPAHAAEFVYKFGNNVPEAHPTNVAMRKAAERIRQDSNGRLEVQLFPNNQLGGDT